MSALSMYLPFYHIHAATVGGQKQGCYSFELELETVMSHRGVAGTKPPPERLVI